MKLQYLKRIRMYHLKEKTKMFTCCHQVSAWQLSDRLYLIISNVLTTSIKFIPSTSIHQKISYSLIFLNPHLTRSSHHSFSIPVKTTNKCWKIVLHTRIDSSMLSSATISSCRTLKYCISRSSSQNRLCSTSMNNNCLSFYHLICQFKRDKIFSW